MADLEIRGLGSYERAEGGLRRAVNTERWRTVHARNRAIENDRATIIHERKGLLHRYSDPLMLMSKSCNRSKSN
jgi:hypothetical protein